MASYNSCPQCGREAKHGISSNWFPLRRCRKCDTLFCNDCAGSGGACPECRSDDTQTSVHKVYAQ